MVVQLMSDLHFEFHRDGGQSFLASVEPKAEILVLAGDIITAKLGPGIWGSIFRDFCSRWQHVLYVPGNHEYYGMRASDAHQAVLYIPELLELHNLHVLGPGKILVLGYGKRFVGATLWFSEPPPGTNKRGLTDYAAIREFEPWVYEQHREAVAWLTDVVAPGDVVITHHLPSFKSVPDLFKGSDLNHFFVHDMEEFILDRKPAAWLHGHTHTSCQYQIGATTVACNVLGYPRETSGFREDFLVEV